MANRKNTKHPAPITLRLKPEELAQLEKDSGGKNRSEYIRSRLFCEKVKAKRRYHKTPVKDHKALSQVLGLLASSRIANNLNQIAYRANVDSFLLTPEVEAQIKEAYDEIQLIRQLLMKALGYKQGHGGSSE